MYDLASSLVSLASPAPSLTEEGAGDARLLVPCRHFGKFGLVVLHSLGLTFILSQEGFERRFGDVLTSRISSVINQAVQRRRSCRLTHGYTTFRNIQELSSSVNHCCNYYYYYFYYSLFYAPLQMQRQNVQ